MTADVTTITLADAMVIASEAVRIAGERGLGCSVCVCDAHGLAVAALRTDTVDAFAVTMARTKAYTAAVLRLSTAVLGEAASPTGPLAGIEAVAGGTLTTVAGGEPLCIDTAYVGGLGVSGGTPAEDREVALAAIQRWLAGGPPAPWPAPSPRVR